MTSIGDNGGPPLEKWTAARKLERIKEIMLTGMSAAQKCIGVGIVVHADTDGVAAEMSTALLQTIASVKDRETVYRATERLEREHVAAKHRVEGRPNNYRVMSARVMQEIESAFLEQTRPVQPDGVVGSNPTGVEPHTRPVQPDGVVRSNPTGVEPHTRPVQPDGVVRSNPTGVAADAPVRAPTHARIEPPSGVHIPLEDNNNPPLTPREIELAAEMGVEVNGKSIKAPGIEISYASIEIAVGLNGMSVNRAKRIALGCIVGWVSSGLKPQNPPAMIQAAIRSDLNQGQIQELRIERAATVTPPARQPKPAASDRRAKIAAWADEVHEHKESRK